MNNKTNIFMLSLRKIACVLLIMSLISAMTAVHGADTSAVYDTDDKSGFIIQIFQPAYLRALIFIVIFNHNKENTEYDQHNCYCAGRCYCLPV